MTPSTAIKSSAASARKPIVATVYASSLPADRSFKVLQPSRVPAQLSLFPPPGLVRRGR